MPLTSLTKDAAKLTLTVVGDYPVPQQRLWDAFADPRQLERFWGPPAFPASFTRHDFKVCGRAEYFLTLPEGNLTLPEGKRWNGSWKFTAVNPISSFEARDGEDNAEDPNLPASMRFTFETTPMGSRLTSVTWFESVEAWRRLYRAWKKGYARRCPNSTQCLLGRDLVLSGSSTLTSILLEHGLADEVVLAVYPVLLGRGKRFFAEGTPPRSFELVSTNAMPSGIILNAYKVAGPLKIG